MRNVACNVRCKGTSNVPVYKMKQRCDGCTYVGRYYSTATSIVKISQNPTANQSKVHMSVTRE